jgi:8-oxo-dGTP pyrophosphatase MutT (NUDIX family)
MNVPNLSSQWPGDEKSIELITMLLQHTPAPFSRHQFTPGHITATGLVLHPESDAIAMVFHGRLERWLLPGGHCESTDNSVSAAAAREVYEETGLKVEGGIAIGADVHGIPPKVKNGQIIEPYHQHHDLLFGFRATTTHLTVSEESHDIRWVPPAEFDAYAVPPNIRRAWHRWTQLAPES